MHLHIMTRSTVAEKRGHCINCWSEKRQSLLLLLLLYYYYFFFFKKRNDVEVIKFVLDAMILYFLSETLGAMYAGRCTDVGYNDWNTRGHTTPMNAGLL